MDLTVLNPGVPALSADLKPGATQLLWIIVIYGFLVTGSLIEAAVGATLAVVAAVVSRRWETGTPPVRTH